MDHWDQLDHQVIKDQKVLLVILESQDNQVLLGRKGLLEQLEGQVLVGVQEILDLMEPLEILDLKEIVDLLDHKALKGN